MVLDYDESDKADAGDKTEGASSEVDTELIQRDASSYNTPTISEVASRTVESIGGGMLRTVVGSTTLLQAPGLLSSKPHLLLPHKVNASSPPILPPHYQI
jgi:hypothetical protein